MEVVIEPIQVKLTLKQVRELVIPDEVAQVTWTYQHPELRKGLFALYAAVD